MNYLEVSFAEPVGDGTLTYHLPPGSALPEIGCRAVVPVHGRRLIGYITAIHQQPPEFKTLAVIEIIDPVPLFSQTLLQLAHETARDCVCTVGEILHAMLPGGIKQKITRHLRAATKENDNEALAWLAEQGWVTYQSFAERFPALQNKISAMVSAGVMEISHSVSRSAGPRLVTVLKPASDRAIDLERLTEKEKLVLQTLTHLTTAPTASLLAKIAQTSLAPINQLKKKGLIIECEERIRREVAADDYYHRPADRIPELSQDQKKVLDEIRTSFSSDRRPVLVRGVTCSGKTEVYLRWVAEILAQNRTAIVLVPEISLTPQMMKRFKDRFGTRVAILHSRLSAGERFDQWESIRSGECPVVVGARSAVFAPLPRLGTIILDEEGEPSFKQGDAPRYHAREIARRRCELENALLVMGSATPTIDSFYYSNQDVYRLVEMASRVSNRLPPQVKVVDMRYELVTRKNRSVFSGDLSQAIVATLQKKQQVILYLNRRGYSSFVFCRECGEAIECSQCRVSLVYHSGSQVLRCHYCGEMQSIPKICPKCQSNAIKFFGAGTQRVEAEAQRYFPTARIARLDSDTVSTKGSMEDLLDKFGRGEIDILIGTQMVAKGLDFPNVTLVGILAADSLLRLPDFRASERNFSLLAQVSGRAGRGDCPGSVILQTYFPEHHSIRFALSEDYHGFYKEEARLRKEALFPPFVELASFIIAGSDRDKAHNTATALAQALRTFPEVNDFNLFGPAPASIEKLNGRYRFQMMLKLNDLEQLTTIVRAATAQTKKIGDTRISIDINPFFML